MKNIKVIARQIAPDYQESPFGLLYDKDFYKGIIIAGNRDFMDFYGDGTEAFTFARRELEDGYLFDDLQAIEKRRFGDTIFKNATEAIRERFPREKPYTTREIGEIKKIVNKYGEWRVDDDKTVCELLKITTGAEWQKTTIRGCCQSDWNTIIYRADLWDAAAIERIEKEYFNEGSEWEIRYADEDSDEYEFTQYCYEWSDDGIKKEIADETGVQPDEVQLEVFDGWSRTEKYRIA